VLKITITETQTENRWVLQGRLVRPWVRELRSCWKKKHRTQSSQRCVIDLNDVTFIDKSGERLLRAMFKQGAELVANGMYTKHVLDMVKIEGKRRLPKLLACLFAALMVSATIHEDCVRVGPKSQKTNAEPYLGPGVNPSNASSRSDFANGQGGILCPQNS
jgi:ABC-type transporter Mla MlaB component